MCQPFGCHTIPNPIQLLCIKAQPRPSLKHYIRWHPFDNDDDYVDFTAAYSAYAYFRLRGFVCFSQSARHSKQEMLTWQRHRPLPIEQSIPHLPLRPHSTLSKGGSAAAMATIRFTAKTRNHLGGEARRDNPFDWLGHFFFRNSASGNEKTC